MFCTVIVIVVVYFILIRLLYLVFSANLGLVCTPHPSMGPLTSLPKDGRVSCFGRSSGRLPNQLLTVHSYSWLQLSSAKLVELAGPLGYSPRDLQEGFTERGPPRAHRKQGSWPFLLMETSANILGDWGQKFYF